MNQNIINVFEEYKHTLSSSDTFKMKQANFMINLIKNLNYKLTKRNYEKLSSISSVGEKSLNKIYKGLMTPFKYTITDLTNLYGLGPKNIEKLKDHKIYNMSDINKSNKHLLSSQALISLKYAKKLYKPIPRKYIMDFENYIKSIVKYDITICGSYRRGCETSNDIDILIGDKRIKTKTMAEKVLKEIIKIINVEDTLFPLETLKTHFQGYMKYKRKTFRLDIVSIPYESLPFALLYFTGSRKNNIEMRKQAKLLGYKLNEYGLWKLINNTYKRIKNITTEKNIYSKLLLEYDDPTNRSK